LEAAQELAKRTALFDTRKKFEYYIKIKCYWKSKC